MKNTERSYFFTKTGKKIYVNVPALGNQEVEYSEKALEEKEMKRNLESKDENNNVIARNNKNTFSLG